MCLVCKRECACLSRKGRVSVNQSVNSHYMWTICLQLFNMWRCTKAQLIMRTLFNTFQNENVLASLPTLQHLSKEPQRHPESVFCLCLIILLLWWDFTSSSKAEQSECICRSLHHSAQWDQCKLTSHWLLMLQSRRFSAHVWVTVLYVLTCTAGRLAKY